MAHFLFNVSKPEAAQGPAAREHAAARLRTRMWPVDADEVHRDRLRTGDLVLIYLGAPEREFVGHVRLGSAIREWTASEARAYPADSLSGVDLSTVEVWDTAVPMDDVVRRVDPAGKNPYVQANARAGFQRGVVEISAGEYEAVLALHAERVGDGVTRP
ncbi:MAG: hypothetical protein ACJ78H_03035 [Chloroflexota bacterium]